MATIAPRVGTRDRTHVSPRLLMALVGGLAIVALATRILASGRVGWVQTFMIVFGSLLISALPFVAVGALAAAAIGVFVPIGTLERLTRLPRPLQLPAAGLAGVAFPICECGSVPVARRLMLRGLTPGAAITFMLAAPIVNPVVMASTFVAFRGRAPLPVMVLGRFGMGLLVAMTVGWVLGRYSTHDLLRSAGQTEHEHEHEPVTLGRPEPRWRTFFVHLVNDFLFMGRYLLLGATVAALVQTFLPQTIIGRVAAVPILDAVALMVMAAILSLCSESDAFIAASFTQFGPASQLAFLVFGPMFDLKLGAMYAGTFQRRVLRAILVTAGVMTLVGTMWLRVVSG